MFILCYIPCPTENEAKKIAHELIKNKLAGCCNVIPSLHSIYEWQNEIQEDREFILLAKTLKENFTKLEAKVSELHSYDCPCIVALNLAEINSGYATWLSQQCQFPKS